MCGVAMVRFHISSEEFFNLSPIELYYAGKAVGEKQKQDFEQKLFLARAQAWMTGLASRIKELPKTADGLVKFAFENDKGQKNINQPIQSVEEQKAAILSIAKRQNERVAKEKKLRTTPPVLKARKMKRKQKPK